MNLNKVQLIGRVSKAPEMKTTQSGQSVASTSIATTKTWNDKAGQKQTKTDWHNIVFWGRLAEIFGQYVVKGQEIYVEGRLEYRTYTGKDGIERKVTDIIAENMQMGAKPQGSQNSNSQNQTGHNVNTSKNEEIPTINLDEEQDPGIDEPF